MYNIYIHFILHNSKFQVFNVQKFQHASFMVQKRSIYRGCFLTGGTSARKMKYIGCFVNGGTRGRAVILHEEISKTYRIKFCRNPFSFRTLPPFVTVARSIFFAQRTYPSYMRIQPKFIVHFLGN